MFHLFVNPPHLAIASQVFIAAPPAAASHCAVGVAGTSASAEQIKPCPVCADVTPAAHLYCPLCERQRSIRLAFAVCPN